MLRLALGVEPKKMPEERSSEMPDRPSPESLAEQRSKALSLNAAAVERMMNEMSNLGYESHSRRPHA